MTFPGTTQCYCCEKKATTRDHIPPKCFFPKAKHLPENSPNYRNNLITVPSCSEHNNCRSKDDQYTAVVIAMNSESNIAFSLLKSKWTETMLKNEASLGKRICSKARKVPIISEKGNLLILNETLAIPYEWNRIESVIKSIACGIYYLESNFQEKWIDDIYIDILISPARDSRPHQKIHELREINQSFIDLQQEDEKFEIPKKGSNPKIFYYQFLKTENNDCLIRIVFYDDFIFIVTLKKSIPIFL